MHYLYILYSEKVDQYYTGETRDVSQRVKTFGLPKIKR
jgi:predicted GIY-YIG superfamily endonuclease